MAHENEIWTKCISSELSALEDNCSQKIILDLMFYFHWKTITSILVVTVDWAVMVLMCGLAQHSSTRNRKKNACWYYMWFNMLHFKSTASSVVELLATFSSFVFTLKQLRWFCNCFQKAYNIGETKLSIISVSTKNPFIAVTVKFITYFNFSFTGTKNDR